MEERRAEGETGNIALGLVCSYGRELWTGHNLAWLEQLVN